MADPVDASFERGVTSARLSQHDAHFARINGSIADCARELHGLTLSVQRLGDAADADRATVRVTAEALEKAELARRDKQEDAWSPVQRLSLVVAIIGAVVGLWLTLRGLA